MLGSRHEFFPAESLPRSRHARSGLAFATAFLIAASAWAGGESFTVSYRQPACGTGQGVSIRYGQPMTYRPPGSFVRPVRPYTGIAYRPYAGVAYASGGNYYHARGAYGTAYGYNSGYFSRFDFGSTQFREDRRLENERQRQERQAERDQREYDQQRREATAYRPPPPTPYEVSLYGYDEARFEQAAATTLARNQREAKAAYLRAEAPPPPPSATEGMTPVGVGDDQYYYSEGKFFALDGEDNLVEVDAPRGAVVFSIPDDHDTVKKSGITFYVYNETYYTRIQAAGRLVYKVAPNPE